MKNNWFLVRFVFFLFFAVFLLFALASGAEAETLYVVTRGDPLNGRARPECGARIEARFEPGEALEPLSYRNGWVEVVGGETGTVWCSQKYLSSVPQAVKYRNASGGRVFVRDDIRGAKTGLAVPANTVVTVRRQMDGWGYIGSGWVNLEYFEEE